MIKTVKSERAAFAERLNQALDEAPIDAPLGRGRQRFVGRMFGVDYTAARKWLTGEGFPTLEKSIEIAKILNVGLEWLLTGRGDKRVMDDMSTQLARLLDLWWQMSEGSQNQLLIYAKFLVDEGRPKSAMADKDATDHKGKIQH